MDRGRVLAATGALPLALVVIFAGLAQALPESILWVNGVKHLLLAGARLLPLLWFPWALWALRQGAWRPALVGATLAFVGGGLPPVDEVEGPGLVVVSANVQAFIENEPALEAALATFNADVLVTIEKRGQQVAGMRRVADNYDRPMPRTSHGLAVYCRDGVDCDAEITGELGAKGCTQPMALARVNQGALCLVGIHVPPPVPLCATGARPYIQHIVEAVEDGRLTSDLGPCRAGDPALIMGDLNAVRGSDPHKALLAQGLSDPLLWRGIWATTWPSGGRWPNLPLLQIDHALVGDLTVEGVRVHRVPDSDHKALRLRVRPG
ncbi:endonuclease/exonuclease/phosphatase family protein [Myxococcota bacterium]|nr:endonuclease/exonuclease/phosphatase family protein [Myxococcota bacterium]